MAVSKPRWADGRELAGVGGWNAIDASLPHECVEREVDSVERRLRGAAEVVGVGCADYVWVCTEVGIARDVGQGGVGASDRAGVWVEAEVFVGLADDAQAIGDWIEIQAKCGSGHWEGRAWNDGRCAGDCVDRVNVVRGSEGIEDAIGSSRWRVGCDGAEIDGEQELVGRQAGDGDVGSDQRR